MFNSISHLATSVMMLQLLSHSQSLCVFPQTLNHYPIQQNRVVLSGLDPKTKYCVQVQINTDSNPHPSKPSAVVCDSTDTGKCRLPTGWGGVFAEWLEWSKVSETHYTPHENTHLVYCLLVSSTKKVRSCLSLIYTGSSILPFPNEASTCSTYTFQTYLIKADQFSHYV